MIVLDRNVPFENTTLDFLEPLINVIKNIISFKRLESYHDEFDNITSFFIKQVPAAVAMFDRSMCYKFASDTWCKIHNHSAPYNVIGKCHYEITPQQPQEWREIHARGLAGETVSCKAEKIIGFSENPIWMEWIVHPWYTPNKLIGGIIIYVNNVTDQINSEEKLNATIAELTRSNQALERFAHVCSHDLKEPLRSASGFMNLLFKRNSQHFDEESLSFINHISKSMRRMSTLIHDLLSFSEVKHRSKHKKKNLELNEIVDEAKESFDLIISEIGAKIKIGALPTILGIKTQFNQLFTNLIGNAIKFRSENPLVIDVFAVDKDAFWEIHVRDNGIGIDEKYQKDIFEMFKRLHSKSQYEGSGIGLATCKRIVADLGGEIYVQTAPEGGSDFMFTLPKM
jgi:light-regulated signal transduction histidine kinase (bacteriophytochrome)